MVHTATVGGGFDVLIPAKKSASVVVTEVGTLDYYCPLSPQYAGPDRGTGKIGCLRPESGRLLEREVFP